MAAASGPPPGGRYPAQLAEAARLVADRVNAATGGGHPWRLVYQSRSGPPVAALARPGRLRLPGGAGRGRGSGRGAGPGRLHHRPHGGHPRPGRRGGGDRPAARPAAGPRGDPGNRPALRLDDHRAGHRAAGRPGHSRPRWARWACPGLPAGRLLPPGCPRRTVPAVRRAHERRGGRPGPGGPARAGPVGRRRGGRDAGRPPPGRPAGPSGGGGHQVQPDRRGDRDGPGGRGADQRSGSGPSGPATPSWARRAASPARAGSAGSWTRSTAPSTTCTAWPTGR